MVLPGSGEVTWCPRVRSLIPVRRTLYTLGTCEQNTPRAALWAGVAVSIRKD